MKYGSGDSMMVTFDGDTFDGDRHHPWTLSTSGGQWANKKVTAQALLAVT
ncbi:hypothetical protein ACIQAA_07495 [Neobacillus sp. NPDC093182]